MAEISILNGYDLKDKKSRADIAGIKDGTIKVSKAALADRAINSDFARNANLAEYYESSTGNPADPVIEEKRISDKFNEVDQTIQNVANGVNRGYSFDSIDRLIGDLEGQTANTKYKIGDELYIKSTDKPDYWVAEVKDTKGSAVTSISDGATVGYWVLYKLGEKTDLTLYQTKTDTGFNTTAKTVTGAVNELDTRVDTAFNRFTKMGYDESTFAPSGEIYLKKTVSNRAVEDSMGNNIVGTYAKKSELPQKAGGAIFGTVCSGGDVTIENGVIAIKDDSHNHTIANIDELQSVLDEKALKSEIPAPYKHPTSQVSRALGLYKIAIDNEGHVWADSSIAVTKSDITAFGIPSQDTTYAKATSTVLGLVKIGYASSGKNYAVALDEDGKMYVNVPWTDTIYTLPAAMTTVRGGVKVGAVRSTAVTTNAASSTDGRYYMVERDSAEKLFVNIPWQNTTYNDATQSVHGLMSAADKTKLDKIGISVVGEEMTIALG